MKKKRIDKYEVTLYVFIFLIMIFNIMLFLNRSAVLDVVDKKFGGRIDFNEIEINSAPDSVATDYLNTEILQDSRVKNLRKTTIIQKNLVSENRNPFEEK